MEQRLYRMMDLVAVLRLSPPTIRKLIREGRFPAPIYPAGDVPRWTRDQIDTYMKALQYLPALREARQRGPKPDPAAPPVKGKRKDARVAPEETRGKFPGEDENQG